MQIARTYNILGYTRQQIKRESEEMTWKMVERWSLNGLGPPSVLKI